MQEFFNAILALIFLLVFVMFIAASDDVIDVEQLKKKLSLNDFSPFFKEFWGRSFDFMGKTNRRRFWLTVLQVSIVYFFLIGIPIFIYVYASLNNSSLDANEIESVTRNISLISWFGAIINFIPGISLQIRRLNDIGKEPSWVLLSFVPFISLVLIFWYAKPSRKKRIASDKKDSNLNSSEKTGLNNLDYTEERLEKLKSMVDKGLISNKEYEELRKKALGL